MKYLKYFFVFLFCTSFLGCKKDFGDLNVSPNSTTTPPTSALLTNVESQLFGTLGQNTEPGFFVQYYTELQYPGSDLYQTTSLSWDSYYAVPLEDLKRIIELCQNNPSAAIILSGNPVNQIQIARILKVYFYSILTDKFGDIPYSSALTGQTQISYDKQASIYDDFFKELTAASNSFENSGTPIKGDIIYNGDLSKWIKFANSLRLSLAMRLSKVNPTKGKIEFNAALTSPGGYIKSNADNFTVTFTTSFTNPYSTLSTANFFAITKTIADTLNKYSDPRTIAYGQANSNGKVTGVPYGLNRGHNLDFFNANPDYSQAFNASFKTQTSSIVLLSAAYIDLLRAEAALDPNYATGENALTLYTQAVQESWSQWGVSGDLNVYLPSLGISSTVSKFDVDLQMWISLYGSTQNAWNEWRRTGVPVLIPSPDAVNQSKQIPRRYAYPLTEVNLNEAAYNAVISSFPYGGTDTHDNRVWWDKP